MKTIRFISELPLLIKNHALREIFLMTGNIVTDAWLDKSFVFRFSTDGEDFWKEISKGNYRPYYEKYGFPDKWKIKILPEWVSVKDYSYIIKVNELLSEQLKYKDLSCLKDNLKNYVGDYLYNHGEIKKPFSIESDKDCKIVTLEDYELYKRYSKNKELEDAAEIMGTINKPEVFCDLIGDPETDPKEEFQKMKKDKIVTKAEKGFDVISSAIDMFIAHISSLGDQIEGLKWNNAVLSSRVDELVSANEKKKAIIEHLKRQKEDLLKEIKSLRKNK